MEDGRDLYALGQDEHEGERVRTMVLVRSLEGHELAEIRRASSLLSRMTEHSGLADLRRAQSDFDEVCEDLCDMRASSDIERGLRRVQREFKGWLSAFRAFDDQTKAWLSKTFGKDSGSYAEFKRALSSEYDANFAYRLAATLRNASEHVQGVLNRISARLEEGVDGEETNTLSVQLDGPLLCETFPKLKASVRHELAMLTKPIEVHDLMGAANLACERAHCRLLLSLWDELETAASLCDRLHAEAVAAGGLGAGFLNTEALVERRGEIRVEFNAKEWGDLVRRNRREAEILLDRGPLVVTPQDLT